VRDDVLVLAELVHERLHVREGLGIRTELRRIGLDGGVRHLGHHLVVLRFNGRQFVEHHSST
jgi:hypothetical protein